MAVIFDTDHNDWEGQAILVNEQSDSCCARGSRMGPIIWLI